jgi:RimJ/RimL family protein N-acetyltransferase
VGIAPPPYRIETERLVIRCYEPRDAALLKEAVDSSLDHLRPWMPWARDEPTTINAKVELLRSFRGRFDLDEDFVYGLFARDESRLVGGSGLHTRHGEGALEIGYWVRADAEGRGLATESVAVLTRAAFEHCGVDRIEIRVDPSNERSLRVPERLGYRREAILRRRLPQREPGGELRDAVVFTLFASELQSSPAAAVGYRGFDAAGRKIPPRRLT